VVVIGEGFEALGRLPLVRRERVSDHFNERRTMLILEGAEIEGSALFDRDADELAINRSEILLVVPIEESYTSDGAEVQAAMKETHRVRLMVGTWVVEGDIHVTPEVSVERFINMGHGDFLPLTRVVLSAADAERNEHLVLVSRTRIKMLRPLAAIGAEEPGFLRHN
jgi:hypothetical protein